MLAKAISSIALTTSLALVIQPVIADDKTKKEQDWNYETLKSEYENGACRNKLKKDDRTTILITLQDVIAGAIGGDSTAADIIGDIDVFAIGRDINPALIDIYEYADRNDVGKTIEEDFDRLGKEVGTPEASAEMITTLRCSIYTAIANERSPSNSAVADYLRSLNKRVMHANMNKLQKLTQEYE